MELPISKARRLHGEPSAHRAVAAPPAAFAGQVQGYRPRKTGPAEEGAEIHAFERGTPEDVGSGGVERFTGCFQCDAAALEDRYGGGRPSLWTAELEALLLAALRQRPDQLGFPGPNWTIPLLQEHLERCGGQRLSDDTIRRQMRRLDYVWKRSRYVLPPDPEREKTTRHPAAAEAHAAAECALG